ncbi:sigma-70 family RNA polymerase sigma factor [Alicyclobacillus macrosporangiidus]|uniref:sigma-70 family RNA polymerase sigma factor n=1 Tax=Alicyclobacillus macrosporangiidus TaxID=392015 RepID=UPI000496B51B|nr:sigma-70 family RNA polymerase sigma factor [Alicyclobacillus macrosporangiidus]
MSPHISGEKANWLRCDNRDSETQMFVNYLHLVDRVAHQVKRRLPPHICLDDLRAAGMEGLWTAIRAYDPNLAVPFDAYARVRIRGAIFDELRRMDEQSRYSRQRQRQAYAAYSTQTQAVTRVSLDQEERHEWIVDDSVIQPEEAVLRSAEVAALNRALAKLSQQEQLVLAMVFIEGLSLTETAEVLSLSRSRVNTIYHGALKSLRGSLLRARAR